MTATAAFQDWQVLVQQVAFLGFCLVLVLAAVSDLRRLTIPNTLVLATIGLWLVFAIASPSLSWNVLLAVACSLGVVALGLPLFARGIVGGGDVKLIAAVALWAGPSELLPFLFHTAIAGGVLTLAWLFSAPLRYALNRVGLQVELQASRQVPYAVAIATGGLLLASRIAPMATL